ncbi:MAG TPA: class I SAM-dependent methyltransferase, partial [Ktedonobacteraceae bacterium]
DTPLAPGIAKMLVTACELDIFDILDERAYTLDELAARLQCNTQGLHLLLNILITAGYLRVRSGHYSITRVSRRWLIKRSRWNIAPYILHSPDIVAIWDHVPEMLHSDQPVAPLPYGSADAEAQRMLARHYAGLAALATALGREIIWRAHLPKQATQLLDVGGSHAGYSALFCQRYPALHATILDLSAGLQAGKYTARQQHLEDRLHFVEANIVQDDFTSLFSEQFDAALYFHIAHLLPPELNQLVLNRTVRLLKPGGTLIFLDQVTNQVSGLWLAAAIVQFMAITMQIVGGTCYSFPIVKSWLEQAGMIEVRKHYLLTPGATLITARKADRE